MILRQDGDSLSVTGAVRTAGLAAQRVLAGRVPTRKLPQMAGCSCLGSDQQGVFTPGFWVGTRMARELMLACYCLRRMERSRCFLALPLNFNGSYQIADSRAEHGSGSDTAFIDDSFASLLRPRDPLPDDRHRAGLFHLD